MSLLLYMCLSTFVFVQVKEIKLELNNNEISCLNKNIVMVNGYSETTVEVSLSFLSSALSSPCLLD